MYISEAIKILDPKTTKETTEKILKEKGQKFYKEYVYTASKFGGIAVQKALDGKIKFDFNKYGLPADFLSAIPLILNPMSNPEKTKEYVQGKSDEELAILTVQACIIAADALKAMIDN